MQQYEILQSVLEYCILSYNVWGLEEAMMSISSVRRGHAHILSYCGNISPLISTSCSCECSSTVKDRKVNLGDS